MNRLTPAHQGAMPPPAAGTGQLARYDSAPGSFLAALADSVTRGGADPPPVSRFCSGESSGLNSSESTCRTDGVGARPLERAYGGSREIRVPPPHHHHQPQLAPPTPARVQNRHGDAQGQLPPVSPLLRHSSSPAGFLSRLMDDPHGDFCR